jgi:Dolichyl-phosphate-mannose-protein mannosyltransferase
MKFPKYVYLLVFLILAVFVFACLVNKAQYSSLTTDESFSYLAYVPSSVGDILACSDSNPANHPLNSLLMKAFASVFGPTELALRLPNLLMFLVYALYGMWLVYTLPKRLAIGVYLLLLTHPTMLELFGLARGYGLGSAFMLAGVYHAYFVLEKGKKVDLWMFHAAFALAVLSHVLFLPAYLAAIAGLHLLLYLQQSDSNAPQPGLLGILKAEILPFGLALLVLFVPVQRMIVSHTMENGGQGGFWETTMLGFAERWWQGFALPPLIVNLIGVLVVGVMLAVILTLVLAVRRKEKNTATKYEGLIFTQVLIWLLIVAFVVEHALFGQNYLGGRSLIILFPPFVLQLGYVLHHNRGIFGDGRWSSWAMLALGLLSLNNFVMNAPRDAYREWAYEAETAYMMGVMENDHDFHFPEKHGIQLGGNKSFEPTLNYYRLTRNLDWLAPVNGDGVLLSDDYVYEFDSLWSPPDTTFVAVENFFQAKTTLWRRQLVAVP